MKVAPASAAVAVATNSRRSSGRPQVELASHMSESSAGRGWRRGWQSTIERRYVDRPLMEGFSPKNVGADAITSSSLHRTSLHIGGEPPPDGLPDVGAAR